MGGWVDGRVSKRAGGWVGGWVGGHYTNQIINISRCQILELAHRTGVNVSLIMG